MTWGRGTLPSALGISRKYSQLVSTAKPPETELKEETFVLAHNCEGSCSVGSWLKGCGARAGGNGLPREGCAAKHGETSWSSTVSFSEPRPHPKPQSLKDSHWEPSLQHTSALEEHSRNRLYHQETPPFTWALMYDFVIKCSIFMHSYLYSYPGFQGLWARACLEQ